MSIRLQNEQTSRSTTVSNRFIDYYMPSANGEFVKVYLYLLRSVYSGSGDISVCTLADNLNHTEKDICRALRYWEKCGLLKLVVTSGRKLESIVLLDVPMPSAAEGKQNVFASGESVLFEETSANESSSGQTAASPAVSSAVAPAVSSAVSPTVSPAVSPAARDYASESHKISRARMSELSMQDDIHELLIIIEEYMGKTLSSNFISTILYFYDELHFSSELIEFLVEYCVSKGKKSIRYMESVALAWHSGGITTVEQAREDVSMYSQSVYTVMKSFGIQGRNPVTAELTYIRKWTNDYGFTIEVISRACERTMAQIHQPSFEYADKILSNWQTLGVHEEKDIAVLDTGKGRKPSAKAADPSSIDTRNRFNNFEQRDYDFQKIEKALLGIQ